MDLNRVTTFLRVVEAGTFTAAAKHLHLPTSSVSRSVAKLEQDLGIVLLERTTRKVSLSDAGRAYYERAREAVAGLDEATVLAVDAARDPSGVVRLAAPPETMGKLAATIGAFVQRHPKIHVDVTTTARGAELLGAEVDVAIVLGPLEDASLIVRKLGTTMYRMFASASYIERFGKPRTAADLSRHQAVLYRGSAGRATWELVGPHGPERVEVKGPISGDSFQLVLGAIAGGHGIGLVPEGCLQHVHHPLIEVPLVPVLPKFAAPGALQSLVSLSRHMPRRVKLLREFLAEHLLVGCPGAHRSS